MQLAGVQVARLVAAGVEVGSTVVAVQAGRQVQPPAWAQAEARAQAGMLAVADRPAVGMLAVAGTAVAVAVPTVEAAGRKVRGCQRLPR